MTAAQYDAMNVQLWQNIGAIADNQSLMKRLAKYVAKLVKEKNDPTLMKQNNKRHEVKESQCFQVKI